MLRQALVDAEAGQRKELRQQQEQQANEDTPAAASSAVEATVLASSAAVAEYGAIAEYGATQNTGTEDVDAASISSDDGDFLSQDDEDDDDEEEEDEEVAPTLLRTIWNGIKTLVRVVADVENLWDSPSPPYSDYARSAESRQHRRLNQYVVLFWFVVLASSYAGERSTFKLLVDRAGPFRLFSVQMLTFSHALILGCGMLVSYYIRLRQRPSESHHSTSLGVPLVDCVLMAVLDTISLVLVFLTGAHVPPTLTVILVQFTIPLAAFLTQFMHPDGRLTFCRPEVIEEPEVDENRDPLVESGNPFASPRDRHHSIDEAVLRDAGMQQVTPGDPLPGWGGLASAHVWGSLILFLAVSLALCPAFYSIADPDFFVYADAIPTRTAINTLFFVSSCIPAAASQLYKEHIFLQYKQPVNMDYLNLLLSMFQFIFASIASPLVYGLQGLGSRGDWTKIYPAADFSDNFFDGLKCFFGFLDVDDQENKYPEDAECRLTLGLVLLHVTSIIAVGVAVDKIVNAGATKVMYRGISAGIIVAVLSMHYYDMHTSDFSYGPAIDALNLACLILLVLGSEVYHRSNLHESTFETVYPAVVVPTFDGDD